MSLTASYPGDAGDLNAWLLWLETLHPTEIELGLARIREVAQRLDLLNIDAKVVSIAGTNGKGSCVEVLKNLLLAQDYTVGSYSSPHLLRFNERICINGEYVDDETLCMALQRVESVRESTSLTYFEFTTLAALLIFNQQNLDVFVLEVGLGGRLDAVNVIDADISVITSIAMDHEAWLGNNRERIGFEKAGILRRERPCVVVEPEPPQSLLDKISENTCPHFVVGKEINFYLTERIKFSCESLGGDLLTLEVDAVSLPAPSILAALQVYALLGGVWGQ